MGVASIEYAERSDKRGSGRHQSQQSTPKDVSIAVLCEKILTVTWNRQRKASPSKFKFWN